MTDEASSDNYCYRHPERESYVLCQRCAKTVCGECQTPAPVGVHCPECSVTASAHLRQASVGSRRGGLRVAAGYRPTATYILLAVIGATYAAQFLTGGIVTQAFWYNPQNTFTEPWRMVTAIFVHSPGSIFHILFNGYSLYILGTLVERLIGPARFVMLFFLAGFGGSVAVLWLSPFTTVVGASGAIFGLFGALFVIQRSFGGANVQLMIVLALNLVLSFVVPGISWQAHVGGLLVGVGVAAILVATRGVHQAGTQRFQLALVALGLAGATLLGTIL